MDVFPFNNVLIQKKMFIAGFCVEGIRENGTRRSAAPALPLATRTLDSGNCVVGGAHALMLKVASIFGLAPLRFRAHSEGYAVSLSSTMCIYSYILVTVLVLCTISGQAAEINVGMDKSIRMTSRMSQVVSACDVLVVVATAGAGVYGAPRRMRRMLKMLDSVASVDISLGAQYSNLSEKRVCAVLLAILLAFFVLLVDDFFFYANQATRYNRFWEVVANYIAFYVLWFIVVLLELQFAYTALSIRARFRAVNDSLATREVVANYIAFYVLWFIVVLLELQFAYTALSIRARFRAVNDALAHTAKKVAVPMEKVREAKHINMFAIRVAPIEFSRNAANVTLLVDSLTRPGQTVVIKKTVSGESRLMVPPCEAIRYIATLHGSLCEVVQHVDESYGLPVVVILISTLLHLIVTPYFLIMEISVSTKRVHFLILQFLWCAMHVLRMFVIVEPSHYTISEGKRTDELVCRLMSYAPSTGVLPTRLEQFSRQLMLRSLHYAPMGMCTLDRPLVASVIGAVTTYLVILIQFQRFDAAN